MNNELLSKIIDEKQNLKYFHILSAFYILGILTSLIVSARLFPFHIPMTKFNILLTGGTWTIPFTFFIQDIATEVYGYSKSRQIVFVSIPIMIVYIAYLKFTTYLPIPSNMSNISQSYNDVFNSLPRHLVALLVAITIGNLANNFVLSTLKKWFNGKYLPLRFISSTAIGEAALQVIGTTIAWIGSLHFPTEILPFILFSYFYKLLFEFAMTPINIIVCKHLKIIEGVDVY